MADQSGRKIAYGLGKETTRGTAVAATNWLPFLTADFQNSSTFIYNNSVFGVLNKNSGSEIVEDIATGKLAGKVTDKTFGLILLAALGSDSPALHASETLVYDHTFSQSQSNTGTSLTITRKDLNSDKQYALAMLKSLEIDVVVGQFVQFTSDWVSKKGATSSSTVAYTLENEFKAKHATAKMATATSGLAGATAIPLKSFKLTITRTIDPYFVFGSNDPNEIFVEEFDTKGEFVLRYSDQTYETPSFANTLQAISIDLVNTDVTIGTSAHPELKITLPKVTLDTWKVDETPGNITEQTVGFTGLYDFASSSEVTAILTNLAASY